MLAARQEQRVDQPLARDQRALDALELGAEKAVVELALWITSGASPMKAEEIVDDLGESGLWP